MQANVVLAWSLRRASNVLLISYCQNGWAIWLKHFDLIEKVAFVVFFHVHCCPFDKPLPDEHDVRDARDLLDDSIQGAKVPATISDPNTDRRIQEGGAP